MNVVVVGEDEVVAVLFKREVDGCVDEDLIAKILSHQSNHNHYQLHQSHE